MLFGRKHAIGPLAYLIKVFFLPPNPWLAKKSVWNIQLTWLGNFSSQLSNFETNLGTGAKDVQYLNGIPVSSQDLLNLLLTLHRPGVLGHQQLGPQVPHQVHSFGPQQGVPKQKQQKFIPDSFGLQLWIFFLPLCVRIDLSPALSSPNGVEVGERPVNVVGREDSFLDKRNWINLTSRL